MEMEINGLADTPLWAWFGLERWLRRFGEMMINDFADRLSGFSYGWEDGDKCFLDKR